MKKDTNNIEELRAAAGSETVSEAAVNESADVETAVTESAASETAVSGAAGSENSRRPVSKAVYILLSLIATVSGTLTGLFGAVTVGVEHMADVGAMTAQEIADLSPWAWATKFSSEYAREEFISKYMTYAVIAGIIAVASVLILSILVARSGKENIKMNWFDRLWSEVHLLLLAVCAACACLTATPVMDLTHANNRFGFFNFSSWYTPLATDKYFFGLSNDAVFWYCTAGMAALLLLTVISFVTLVRKAAAGELIHMSLTGKLLRLLGIGASKTGKGLAQVGSTIADRSRAGRRKLVVPEDTDRNAVIKLMIKYCLIAVALITIPVFALGVFNEGVLIAYPAAVILAIVLLVNKIKKLSEIRAGVIEVKSGNLTHKISVTEDENGPKTDLDKLASDINHISEATNAAVQNEIKNQRLKTDLISNVSHDLKTPLTSMISYLDILEKEGLDSPDAPAHLEIVREKTERLRTLTEELFEAAKASSGNIPCELETIDISALIDQSLAEMGDRLSRKNLEIRKKIKTDNTLVIADGKLLYRVLENLLGNISKYALEGSRVYIDVSKPSAGIPAMPGGTPAPGKLLLEIKNISRDELNISPDELMERFTRGDQSRNTEGSGLGLAIAKDLVNLMGGVFEIKIDGDMFKASVLLNEAERS